ncbi:nuclear transport factor 2 family protein [Marinimicrobium sp. ABcell2]|uniref:nuclear transport factor 2 family protein n=1 Tax=Marinimicrobium sp. ABcell2 TaxID=3069751 RepID=UPI0027B773F5|nr:nuclear transport factor 2 family protein [Marinimicrobium sp. ABcell2]MDQ2076765.1 nuclear transport factor 2 family protein [Marinimicrobium sp. ABcell2]
MTELSDLLIGYERELAAPEVMEDLARLETLVADDFEEVGSSGKHSVKSDLLRATGARPQYELSDFSVFLLEERTALVKYSASFSGKLSYRSSIWIKNGNQWQLRHHQSTLAR